MRINHNISALSTQGALFKTGRSMDRSLERLSTGLRVNRASDDAAGLAVSENLRTQVRGSKQALKNTQDAISMLSIADGALEEQSAILQRMREVVVQAKNDTLTQTERNYLGTEFRALTEELDRIARSTNYNGMQLFAVGETANQNLIESNPARGTPHQLRRQTNIFDSESEALFGEDDNSSSHHFNFMIGANYSDTDSDAFNGNILGAIYADSYDKNAENMVTFQFGQMDARGILSPDTQGTNGLDLFDDFNMYSRNSNPDPETGSRDNQDWAIDRGYGSGSTPAQNMDENVQDKLTAFLEIIDGNADALPQLTKNGLAPNKGAGESMNVTGLARVNKMRAAIGSMVNRLESNVNNLMSGITNQQSAESAIRDADFAYETSQFTKNQILTESATSMLAQANNVSRTMLTLLG